MCFLSPRKAQDPNSASPVSELLLDTGIGAPLPLADVVRPRVALAADGVGAALVNREGILSFSSFQERQAPEDLPEHRRQGRHGGWGGAQRPCPRHTNEEERACAVKASLTRVLSSQL